MERLYRAGLHIEGTITAHEPALYKLKMQIGRGKVALIKKVIFSLEPFPVDSQETAIVLWGRPMKTGQVDVGTTAAMMNDAMGNSNVIAMFHLIHRLAGAAYLDRSEHLTVDLPEPFWPTTDDLTVEVLSTVTSGFHSECQVYYTQKEIGLDDFQKLIKDY